MRAADIDRMLAAQAEYELAKYRCYNGREPDCAPRLYQFVEPVILREVIAATGAPSYRTGEGACAMHVAVYGGCTFQARDGRAD